jgi:UDPglucose 6-dehydrogenase
MARLSTVSHYIDVVEKEIKKEVFRVHITVVGSGYVGLVAGACLADLGHEVIVVDNDERKVAALNAGEVPIHERFLPELLSRHHGQRLKFSGDLQEAVRQSTAIFVAVGTPPTQNGDADLSYVESVATEIASAVSDYKVIIEKSTVPVYTSEWIRKIILRNGADPVAFDVVSNPEFLREGTAVTDFLYPDRIVIGCDTDRAANVLQTIYHPLVNGGYSRRRDVIPQPDGASTPPRLIRTSAKSAEIIKHASNAFLAMKISFINAVACVCESVGANVNEICEGMGSDSRIGPRFLNPGIGYGGSCFPKDVLAFHAVARECGYDFRLLEEVTRINDEQQRRFIRKVREALWTLRGKRLGVLGLAFKGGTDDIRESPALAVVQSLAREGCLIKTYDPAAMARVEEVTGSAVQFVNSAYEAAKGSDAVLILTDWEEFSVLDLDRLRDELRYPIVIDGRNLYRPEVMAEHGLTYYSIGRTTAQGSDDSVETVTNQAGVA